MEKISVVGLGKLGVCFAAAAASRGIKTIGVDVSDHIIECINSGRAHIYEPGLQEVISKVGNTLSATREHARAIQETDITFILVATPSDTEGNFSNAYVESALKSLALALKAYPKKYHLFVISSTVMPTSTEERLIPIIEEYSGRKLNDGFGVCYVPDFVALGNVIKDFLNPDLVVIGESSRTAGDIAADFQGKLCENTPHIARMSIISAEIAKVSLNAYITTKISFANMLGNICEKISAADVDSITNAIGADKRISRYYFGAGLSYGGTCFPRDTKAFIRFAKKFGYDAQLIKTVENVNAVQDRHLFETVLGYAASAGNKKVSVLGLAFKPKTTVITESPAIKLIEKLLENAIDVAVYDSYAMDNARERFGDSISYASSVADCIAQSSVCVITTPAAEFKSIDSGLIKNNAMTIIDCWRILDPSVLGSNVNYVALGRKPDKQTSSMAIPVLGVEQDVPGAVAALLQK
jgi:UDPglucose 6-dehydrogenase